MTGDDIAIEQMLARLLRGGCIVDPALRVDQFQGAALIERLNYHGIAGLLAERLEALNGWPPEVIAHVRDQAIAQAMWELRHRQLVGDVFCALARARIAAVLLKGTALAYDLYPSPSARHRGDSDLLVEPHDLEQTRRILEQQGFARTGADDVADCYGLQEVWTQTCDGQVEHHIDLHWQLINSPALKDVLAVSECLSVVLALPRLSPDAMAMDRVRTLLHTCIHRALNSTSPYFVDGRTYYGGNRLIWLYDIHLLAGAFSQSEWQNFCGLADRMDVSASCLDGLLAAERFLATPLPAPVIDNLGIAAAGSGPSAYLQARQFGRAWRDFQAIHGLGRKIGYLRTRALPSTTFIRDKYPLHAGLPLPLLYARRLFDLFRARPKQSSER